MYNGKGYKLHKFNTLLCHDMRYRDVSMYQWIHMSSLIEINMWSSCVIICQCPDSTQWCVNIEWSPFDLVTGIWSVILGSVTGIWSVILGSVTVCLNPFCNYCLLPIIMHACRCVTTHVGSYEYVQFCCHHQSMPWLTCFYAVMRQHHHLIWLLYLISHPGISHFLPQSLPAKHSVWNAYNA